MAEESAKSPGGAKEKSEEDVKILSAEADLALAQAKLKEAEARLAKARSPLVDRLIMRGLIPIALAVVGPWAIYKFSTENQETREAVVAQAQQLEEQKNVVNDLKTLLDNAMTYREATAKEEAAWRERMRKLEEQKAIEIAALSAMIVKLNEALKMAVLQITIDRVIKEDKIDGSALQNSRDSVVEQAVIQSQWVDEDQDATREMAEKVFDKILQAREKK